MVDGERRIGAGSYSKSARVGWTAFAALALAASLSLGACAKADRGATPPAKSADEAPAVETPSPRRTEPGWQRAAERDPLDLQRLADEEGADGLLEALSDPELHETALLALPYADDAETALGRLALRAAAHEADRAATLGAIQAIAHRPRRQREQIDAEGIRAATQLLAALAARPDLGEEQRAAAKSALSSLETAGYPIP